MHGIGYGHGHMGIGHVLFLGIRVTQLRFV